MKAERIETNKAIEEWANTFSDAVDMSNILDLRDNGKMSRWEKRDIAIAARAWAVWVEKQIKEMSWWINSPKNGEIYKAKVEALVKIAAVLRGYDLQLRKEAKDMRVWEQYTPTELREMAEMKEAA